LMVRCKVQSPLSGLPQIATDFHVEFAGKQVTLPRVLLQVESVGLKLTVSGSFKLNLRQFDISPPALLGLSVEDEVPIRFESTWQRS
jgi:hypothetical protein